MNAASMDDAKRVLDAALEEAGRKALAQALAPAIARLLYEASALDRLAAYDAAPPKLMGRDGRMHTSPRPKFTSWSLLPQGIRTGWIDKVLDMAVTGAVPQAVRAAAERHPSIMQALTEMEERPIVFLTSPDSGTVEQ